MTVVDASVILSALLSGEPHHEESKTWLFNLANSGQQFSAPALILSEIAAPISRAYDQPDLAKQVVQTLSTAPFAKIVPVSIPLANRAAVIAADYRIRGCDSVYVALAEALGEKLLTLDKQQGERTKTIIETDHP